MKLISAIIKPFKLEAVREALAAVGIEGLTVTEAKGYGRQRGHSAMYRGKEYEVDFLPKVTVDVVVAEENLARAVEAIEQSARTGKLGDGKIFVSDLSEVVRIRTGESGHSAI